MTTLNRHLQGKSAVTLVEPADGIFHFEDLIVGAAVRHGARRISREEIIEFASKFDPQPIHLDEAMAKQSIVGGLCASGFHTCAILMRLLCDHVLLRSTSLGSPGHRRSEVAEAVADRMMLFHSNLKRWKNVS